MRRWWMKAAGAGAALALVMFAAYVAGAVNLCTLTGNLTLIDGQAGANAQVFFNTVSTQSYGGTVVPPSSFSVFTDANGNLPPNVTVPQGAIVQVTIGASQPVQIQIPLAATADLSTLILANDDPPSVVSSLMVGAGGDYGLTVTNPGTGAIGSAVLQPGKVTSIQGSAFSAAAPGDAQLPVFNSGAAQWQPESISGDATLSDSGALSVSGIAAGGNITGKSTGGPFSISDYNVNHEFNPMQYGARLDARRVGDVTVTNGSTVVSSVSANFTPADVGKLIVIWTAGSGGSSSRTFTGTISSVAAPTAVLSAPYGGSSQTNATAFIGTDDGSAINATFNAVPLNSVGVVKVPGQIIMTTQTLEIAGRSIEFSGQGMGSSTNSSGNTGSLIVWAGGNAPVIQITDSQDARVHDFDIIGNNQAGGMPTACIDLLNNSPTLAGHPNSFNRIYNIICGYDYNNPGIGNGGPVAGAGIMADPSGTQDDRNIFQNIRIGNTYYGLTIQQDQASEWDVKDMTCYDVAVCVDGHVGVAYLSIDHLEKLNGALAFWLGQGAYIQVSNFVNEDDNPVTFATPWTAGQDYPINFVIQDPNGNLQGAILTTGAGQTGSSPPAFLTPAQATSWTIASASRSSNVVTVTTTANHDFSAGQTVAIVGTSDSTYIGTFTVTSVPAANQFTYSQTGANSSTGGGTAWHATLDGSAGNSVSWVPIGTIDWSRFAAYVATNGSSGGTLGVLDSQFSAGAFIPNLSNWPYNGDVIDCGFQGDCGFVGRNFALTYSTSHPPVLTPIVDLSSFGSASRYFKCVGCRGLKTANFDVNVIQGLTQQLTYLDVDNAPLANGSGPNQGLGSSSINALVNGDPAGVDSFRRDIMGKLREFGGPLTVSQLSTPPALFGLSCTTGGGHTYRYEVTATSGSGESLPTAEVSVTNCNTINANNPITGGFRPVLGADGYNVYRTGADGASGTEKFAVHVAQNNGPGPYYPNAFTDTTTDANLGGPPPTANSTGNATIAGVLAAGSAAATGAAAGDLSASRGAGAGMLWLGSNGSQSLDFGVTNPGSFSLLGGGLIAPALAIAGSGQFLMGSTTVAGLPACNASTRFGWLTVTDQNAACAYGASPAGGGATVCPVFCDGSSWKVH